MDKSFIINRYSCHCERPTGAWQSILTCYAEFISATHDNFCGLLRHFVPRNDDEQRGFTNDCHSEDECPKNRKGDEYSFMTWRFFASAQNGGRCTAFTLAEVLITLTIIGVIAALTISNLMQKHQEQEMVSRLKKSYTVLSNAFELAIRENGPVEDWGIVNEYNKFSGADKLYKNLEPYLKVQKYCGWGKGCFAESYKTMNGNNAWVSIENDTTFSKVLLHDGTAFLIWIASNICKEKDICANLEIDLNGKKGPNKLGIDYYRFRIYSDKILPAQPSEQTCKYKGTNNQNGKDCGYWVITKGNMDYLRRDISNEW